MAIAVPDTQCGLPPSVSPLRGVMLATRPTFHFGVSAARFRCRVRCLSPGAGGLVVLLGLLLSACASIPLPIPGGREADRAPVLARKLVVAKEAPADLIADDGTRCLTTERRFERTRVGSEAWCVWTGDRGHLHP
jgi:hypothetical protein